MRHSSLTCRVNSRLAFFSRWAATKICPPLIKELRPRSKEAAANTPMYNNTSTYHNKGPTITPLSHGHHKVGWTRVQPTLHLSHAHRESGSTRVLHPSSTRFRRWVARVSKRVWGVKKMADRGRMWTDAKIALLLNVRSENSIQGSSRVPFAMRYKKIAAENSVYRKWNVGLLIIKFLSHSASFHPATMQSKNVWLLFLTHTVLVCRTLPSSVCYVTCVVIWANSCAWR